MMQEINLEGFVYDCSESGIRTIYCFFTGEICIDESAEVIIRCRKPTVGMWCTFKASYQEDGKWVVRKVVLMPYPRLKCFVRENECTVKGIAIVCNITADSGYLWNDYIGLIAVEGQMVDQLKSLTAVEFQAIPLRKSGTPAYFTAKEVGGELESVFQSEVLLFAHEATIKADGRAYVSDCAITLLNVAYSAPVVVPEKISILYYKEYGDNASGVGIYATTDSNIVAGIRDDFFTTKRCFEPCTEHMEVEMFEDASENLTTTLSQSPIVDDEVPIIKIDLSPAESIAEFTTIEEEINKNDCSPKVDDSLAADDDYNCSMNQSFESCSSLNFRTLDNELNSIDKSLRCDFAQKEIADETVVICNNHTELACSSEAREELKTGVVKLDEDEIWDNEFIEYLLHKVKEDKDDEKFNDICKLVYQSQNNSESSKKELLDEVKDRAEMKPVSVPHKTTGAYQIRSDVSTNPGLSVTSQLNVSTNSRPPLTNQFGGCSVAESMWIDEVDKLCVKVLSNARIRNFVSVNENGNAVLCEIMRYLECQMTMEDVNEELAIPLSEVTPECFNIVHEERALSICRKLMKMNGFERISNCKIPEIPEEIR